MSIFRLDSGSQGVGPVLATSVSPGNLLEMQNSQVSLWTYCFVELQTMF